MNNKEEVEKIKKEINLIISNKIESFRQDNNYISYENIAKDYSINKFTLIELKKGKGNITIETLLNISNMLEVPIYSLFIEDYE